MNLQAICDHHLCFTWLNISWPSATFDYMAWVTLELCYYLETTCLLLDEKCIVGDNICVLKRYISVSLKGIVSQYDDAYSFHVSQLRIMIDHSFGVLVHWWKFLRRPLTCTISKVGLLAMCLCRLHKYYINAKDRYSRRSSHKDVMFAVQYMDDLHSHVYNFIRSDEAMVRLDRGRPNGLIHRG